MFHPPLSTVYASQVPSVGVPSPYIPGSYMLATTSGSGNPLLPTVLHGGLQVVGMPLRDVPKGVFLEVYLSNEALPGAIPYGLRGYPRYEQKGLPKVLSRLLTPEARMPVIPWFMPVL